MSKNNKNKTITIRVTEEEYDVIQSKADKTGCTVSTYVRDSSVKQEVREKTLVSPKSFELLSALSIMSSKLNSGSTRQELSEEIAKVTRLAMGQ